MNIYIQNLRQWSFIVLTICLLTFTTYAQIIDDLFRVVQSAAEIVDSTTLGVTEVSSEEELDAGTRIAEEINRTVTLVNGVPLDRVERIGKRIAAQIERTAITPYRFYVVESDTTTNAFSIAGGHVWVYTGMLEDCKDENELAWVLAHEIAHVDLKHCIHKIQHKLAAEKLIGSAAEVVQVGYTIATLPFNRDQEIMADTVGMRLMKQAGYSLDGTMSFIDRMIEYETKQGVYDSDESEASALAHKLIAYLDSHPNFKDRKRFAEIARQSLERKE
ncbi:M48 family metallopeptidase [bacterium]|nr:M48 family metallopeptidase [bacterium]